MILSRPLIRAVQRGTKTQRCQARQPALKPGKSVAVRPKDAPGDGTRIRILNVEPLLLGDISFEDARAEGYRTTDDFKEAWVRENDKAWVAAWEETDPTDQDAHELRGRFICRWADRTVWAIRFELDPTLTPVLISAGWPDYTTSPHLAMTGEPEALNAADHKIYVQDRADLTTEHYRIIQDSNQEALALHERLRRVQETAAEAGVDIRRQELSILNRIRSLESKVRKVAA